MVDRMLDWLGNLDRKPLRVKVTTMDADLNELSIERDALGQQLFDTVCRIIGIREVWYFGLCYTNRKGFTCWLQLDKKIRDQRVPKQPDNTGGGGSLHFLFLVKFFPESVKGELIQDLTRHLFFLQIRQSILAMDLYCPSEAAILLASYAVQALYGDHNQQELELDLAKLLPVSVLQQYEMTAEMWEEKIRNWWANNSGLSREDAEEEFLCVAEELDMYGIQYYPIKNQKDTELLLGVSALGVGIYELDNKLNPRPFFPWTEIKCISFKHKMFTICTADKSKIRFRAQDMSINQSLLDLCVGTHNLYLRRRQPDLLEVQQMKLQAEEQRRRRMNEQARLHREREQRNQAEQERDRYRAELNHLSEQLSAMQTVIRSAEETHLMIAERARLSEQEAMEQARRASEAESEVQRIKMSQLKSEEGKMMLERKMREAEMAAQRLAMQQQQQQPKQNANTNHLHQNGTVAAHQHQLIRPQPPYPQQMPAAVVVVENNNSRQQMQRTMLIGADDGDEEDAEQQQQEKPNGVLASPGAAPLMAASQPQHPLYLHHQQPQLPPPLPLVPPPLYEPTTTATMVHVPAARNESNATTPAAESPLVAVAGMADSRQSIAAELQHIYSELEQSKNDYNEKNQSLRERLLNFRAELDSLKREGTETENDRLFAQKMIGGCFDKQSTLRKSTIGSPKSRVKVFDELITPNG